MDWNSLYRLRPQRARNRFSTLCGSKWIGTQFAKASLGRKWGFSTLCGSKWIGTAPVSRSGAGLVGVSVPSAGRNGLELEGPCSPPGAPAGFQYPLRVEMDWNHDHFWRNDPTYEKFQYPLRVEMDWNRSRRPDASRNRSFSTLCGSKWIGTYHSKPCPPKHPSFSTLCGSKWIGTKKPLIDWKPYQEVSVPSAGRNGLERVLTSKPKPRNQSFSTLCGSKWIGTGLDDVARANLEKLVSVPSAGRNGLEHTAHALVAVDLYRFSTLCGSKWIGTVWSVPAVIIDLKFQYPLRVEMDWNIRSEDTVTHQIVVSVPSAGRNGLELRAQIKDSSICVKGFSTLCGSKWIGTA